MDLNVLYFVSFFTYAIALAPVLAHTAALPNKLRMSGEEYLAAQRAYRGWLLFGLIHLVAVVSTLLLAIELSGTEWFAAALAAFVAITVALLVFFLRVFPANRASKNWTVLPDHWEQQRKRWEYGHATSCGFIVIGLIFLLLAR